MKIEVKMSREATWGNVDIEWAGYDQTESEAALCQIVDGYITEAYPDADVEVLMDFDDSVTVDGEDVHSDNDENARIAEHVEQLVEKAWAGNWEVTG